MTINVLSSVGTLAIDTGLAQPAAPAPSTYATEQPQPGANPAQDNTVATPQTPHAA